MSRDDRASVIDFITDKICGLTGDDSRFRQDMKSNIRALLDGALSRFELVTRDEYEGQLAVLHRNRERLKQLEARVAEIEERLTGSTSDDKPVTH